MGRNGKNASVFTKVVEFVNTNTGKVVNSSEMLLGKNPGRNSETAYLYKLLKLGYVKAISDGAVMDKGTKYKIVKSFPSNYTSVMFMDELKIANGLVK